VITDLIISALLGGLNAILSLLPDYALPTVIESAGLRLGTYAAKADALFPFLTVAQITGLALALRLLMSGYDFLVWLYHQFWGSS